MSDELKPCPFCGESARFDWIDAGCAVECHRCAVSVMRGSVGVGWYATEAEAAADWNRRAVTATDALVEALEHARTFIRNGVELGFIRMPDADTPDPAHETLPKIEAALEAYRASQRKEG